MVEHVSTREEEMIPDKKNSEEPCAFLSTEATAVGTHRKIRGRDKVNLHFPVFIEVYLNGSTVL